MQELAQLTINTVLFSKYEKKNCHDIKGHFCFIAPYTLQLYDNDDNLTVLQQYCNYCKIIVMYSDVKLIDKNKIHRLLKGFFGGCLLT